MMRAHWPTLSPGAPRNGSGVFAIRRASSKRPGAVTWYDAQAEIDTFPDFEEFFLAMIDYNRSIIAFERVQKIQ